MLSDIKQKLQLLTPGHHGCYYYRNQQDAIETIVTFLMLGLERNERCFCLFDPATIKKIHHAFELAGVDVHRQAEKGALILTSERNFLLNGHFDKNRMIDFLGGTYRDTLKAGFSGLRGVGDMVWEFGDDLDLKKLADYERAIDKYFLNKKITALCLYNLKVLPQEYPRDALFCHNAVVEEKAGVCLDNHFYNSLYSFPRSSFDMMCKSLHS
jgi:hypothetical protein